MKHVAAAAVMQVQTETLRNVKTESEFVGYNDAESTVQIKVIVRENDKKLILQARVKNVK